MQPPDEHPPTLASKEIRTTAQQLRAIGFGPIVVQGSIEPDRQHSRFLGAARRHPKRRGSCAVRQGIQGIKRRGRQD